MNFYTFCTNRNRNEYSTEELQNLQLCPNCVSSLPDKTKTAHFEVNYHSILLLDGNNEQVFDQKLSSKKTQHFI